MHTAYPHDRRRIRNRLRARFTAHGIVHCAGNAISMYSVIETRGYPERVCTFECAALSVAWTGPSLETGLGGSCRTARAAARAKASSPTPAHTCTSLLWSHLCARGMLTPVCARDSQAFLATRSRRHRHHRGRAVSPSPRPLRRFPSPCHCRSDVASVCALSETRQRP